MQPNENKNSEADTTFASGARPEAGFHLPANLLMQTLLTALSPPVPAGRRRRWVQV